MSCKKKKSSRLARIIMFVYESCKIGFPENVSVFCVLTFPKSHPDFFRKKCGDSHPSSLLLYRLLEVKKIITDKIDGQYFSAPNSTDASNFSEKCVMLTREGNHLASIVKERFEHK